MATSSGYFSSLAMMYAPRVVHPSQAKIAGMTAALCLMLGTDWQKQNIVQVSSLVFHLLFLWLTSQRVFDFICTE